jgi:hypothetical protein
MNLRESNSTRAKAQLKATAFNCVRQSNPRECRDPKPHYPVILVP